MSSRPDIRPFIVLLIALVLVSGCGCLDRQRGCITVCVKRTSSTYDACVEKCARLYVCKDS